MSNRILLVSVTATVAIACLLWFRIPARVDAHTQSGLTQGGTSSANLFLQLPGASPQKLDAILPSVRETWKAENAILMVEAARVARNSDSRKKILSALGELTGQNFGLKLNAWFRWIWAQSLELPPDYATYKQQLYAKIDSRFAEYFSKDFPATIRLDEVRWGGVRRDGIPPLKNPETIAAQDASYLSDSDVVFGVQIDGHARAYPKRILAWHEMVKDVVGGESINGVYCTLCGSMIVYGTEYKGQHYELGTSGFLYRSNKLMYDHETKSMWSTIRGAPVIGPLVGKGIELKPLYVVTTTWGKWKQLHPETDVLSLRTGHTRDYGEGVAYRRYFATDRLMFTVPKLDDRLKNKDEVLIIRNDKMSHLRCRLAFLSRILSIKILLLEKSLLCSLMHQEQVAFIVRKVRDSADCMVRVR